MTDDLELLLTRIKEDSDPVWTPQRVQAVLGPAVSPDSCRRLLRRIERMQLLTPREHGTWVRAQLRGGAQRDWYT
jgi:hypothetical protein